MFCTQCGKQLADGTRFCIYCGTPVAQEPAPIVPEPEEEKTVYVPAAPAVMEEDEERTVYVHAAEPTDTAPAQEPVYAPEYTAPAQEPVPAPDYTAPAQEIPVYAPVEEPVYVPPVQEAVPTYSDAPAKPVKKKKKTGLIVALVVILLLLIAAGGMGWYLYSQYQANLAAYQEAETLLENRDYDTALDAFTALGDFQDAADRAEELTQLQADYDAALALLAENKFDEATAAFQALADYRDSQVYVDNEIAYQKAQYILSCAKAGDGSALSLVMDENTAYEEGTEVFQLYTGAAEAFTALGGYQDSEALASECWLNAALFLLDRENYDAALSYTEKLTEADAAILNDAYLALCADGQFLADIVDAFVAWYDEYDDCTFQVELENARAILEAYADSYFDNDQLHTVLEDLLDALDTMASTVSGDSVDSWVTYYTGMAKLYALADQLYSDYGVFAGDDYLVDCFVGYTDIVAPTPTSRLTWFPGGTASPRRTWATTATTTPPTPTAAATATPSAPPSTSSAPTAPCWRSARRCRSTWTRVRPWRSP